MKEGDRLRIFGFGIWGVSYVIAIIVAVTSIEFSPPFTDIMHPSFLILSYGMSVAFLAIHFLVFGGKANKSDLSNLALFFTFYATGAFVFVPNPAHWIQFFAISIIVIGVEYIFPDWPVRIYKALVRVKPKKSEVVESDS